ncbi:MAG: hypothetical protein HFJ86_12480 [Oscillospiraceae bacterium]|nr:hypothetical protein [Oscillospiraceae bacterium]
MKYIPSGGSSYDESLMIIAPPMAHAVGGALFFCPFLGICLQKQQKKQLKWRVLLSNSYS